MDMDVKFYVIIGIVFLVSCLLNFVVFKAVIKILESDMYYTRKDIRFIASMLPRNNLNRHAIRRLDKIIQE